MNDKTEIADCVELVALAIFAFGVGAFPVRNQRIGGLLAGSAG